MLREICTRYDGVSFRRHRGRQPQCRRGARGDPPHTARGYGCIVGDRWLAEGAETTLALPCYARACFLRRPRRASAISLRGVFAAARRHHLWWSAPCCSRGSIAKLQSQAASPGPYRIYPSRTTPIVESKS